MNIYLASSWRNAEQPDAVRRLRAEGHTVYDFRDSEGFSWSEIDPAWQSWTVEEWKAALAHPLAKRGFGRDLEAMRKCDACILLLPAGRSACLELGWCAGAGKLTIVVLAPGDPDLMVRLADHVATSLDEAIGVLAQWQQEAGFPECGFCGTRSVVFLEGKDPCPGCGAKPCHEPTT